MLFLCTFCGGMDAFQQTLPGNYVLIHESDEQAFIYKGNNYIPCSVKNIAYNHDYILVMQKPC